MGCPLPDVPVVSVELLFTVNITRKCQRRYREGLLTWVCLPTGSGWAVRQVRCCQSCQLDSRAPLGASQRQVPMPRMSTYPLTGSQHFLLCALLFAQVSSHTESQWLPTILATPGPGYEAAVNLVEHLVNMAFSQYTGILECFLLSLVLFCICYFICLFSFACWRQSITLYPRMALRVFCLSISDYRRVPPCLVYSFLHEEDTQIVITILLTVVTH